MNSFLVELDKGRFSRVHNKYLGEIQVHNLAKKEERGWI